MDTIDNRLLRENLLKSEALLTLSLNSAVEANSAPTLHGKNDEPPVLGVGTLFADALAFLESLAVWPLSRPNSAPHRPRLFSASLDGLALMPCCLSRAASPSAPVSLVR